MNDSLGAACAECNKPCIAEFEVCTGFSDKLMDTDDDTSSSTMPGSIEIGDEAEMMSLPLIGNDLSMTLQAEESKKEVPTRVRNYKVALRSICTT